MNIKGISKEKTEDDDETGFNSKIVDFLKEKVKLDNGENGYVFTKNTDEHPRGRFRCHVCNVPIGSTKSLEEHASGKNHTKKMQANFHSHENFPKIVIKGTPKLFTDVGGKVITAPGVDIPDLAPGEPVPPGFEDIVTRVPEIKATLDEMKAPLIGLEYLAEITPVEDEIEPKYCCLLCNKRGDPRTVLAHLVCFNHRIKYIGRYFPRTNTALALIPKIKEYKRGTGEVLAKIVKAIEDKFGRLNPVIVDGAIFDQKKEEYYREMRDGRHFHETADSNYELLVDLDFIKKCAPEADNVLTIDIEKEEAKKKSTTLKSEMNKIKQKNIFLEHEKFENKSYEKKFSQRNFNFKTKRERSVETISSSGSRSYSRSRSRSPSGSFTKSRSRSRPHYRHSCRDYFRGSQKRSRSPKYYYRSKSRTRSRTRSRSKSGSRSRSRSGSRSRGSSYRKYRSSNFRPKSPAYARSSYRTGHYSSAHTDEEDRKSSDKLKSNQIKLAELRDQRRKRDLYGEFVEKLEKDMAKSLKNYKKNPEKHPLYPEEWKKFWNRRYKELTAEGIDASKHDFKPEWIKFWLVRMRELHKEELEMKKEKYRTELGLSEIEKTSGIDSDVIEVSPTPLEDEKNNVTVDDIKNTWKALTGSEIKSSSEKVLDKTGKSESKSEQHVKVLTVLRLLTALESQLGSLGPRVNNLLSQAIALEKKKTNSSDSLIDVSENQVLFETVKEKLKGQLFAGIVEKQMVNATRTAIQNVAKLFNCWKTRRENPEPVVPVSIPVSVTTASSEPLIVPGIGAVDKVSIAQQIAAALVAQGKTNITEQELEQLINAVVGMAQATTRHTQIAPAVVGLAQATTRHSQISPVLTTFAASVPQVLSPVTSLSPAGLPTSKEQETLPNSLLLHQLVSKSGWGSTSLNFNKSQTSDEGANIKCRKGLFPKDVTDLSEEDMKMLLQNFKDLAAEDQQSLIAHLKELESKDPDSVEKLRKFVDSANESAGKNDNKTKEESQTNERLSPFSMREGGANPFIDDGSKIQMKELDDDEDDYSYEEIYKAAEKKVSGKSVAEQMIEEQQKKVKLSQPMQPSQPVQSSIVSPVIDKNISRETLKASDDPECVLNEAKVMIANIMGQLPTKYSGGATRSVASKISANLKTAPSTETSSTYSTQPTYDVRIQNSHLNKMPNNLLNDYNYQDDIFEYSNDSFHNYSTRQENYHVESTSNEPYSQIQQPSYTNFGNSEQRFSSYESWNDSYSQYPPHSQQQVSYNCPPPSVQTPMVDSGYSRPPGPYQASPTNDYTRPPLYNAYRDYY